jgi:C_GCAxxG_C_C family probable redox protein
MTKRQVEKKTLEYFKSGLCCTEAIVKAVVEIYADQTCDAIPKIGSGFCKGIGRSGEDFCGAVAGGVIALGYLHGRSSGDEDLANPCRYAAEFRDRFLSKYGTTNCGQLLSNFGEQENAAKCKAMTAKAAGIIADMLSGGACEEGKN